MKKATVQDVNLIEELESLVFPQDSMGSYLISLELARGGGFVEDPNGYVLFRDVEPGFRDITRLGVRDSARRMGLGRKLLEAALEGVEKVMLSVRKDNEPALHLYLTKGFRVVGDSGSGWVLLRTS